MFNKLNKKLLYYLELEDCWDGYSAIKPDKNVILFTLDFLKIIKDEDVVLPKVMISSCGEVSFYWKRKDLYIEIGFEKIGCYSYLISNNGFLEGEDDCVFDDRHLDLLFKIKTLLNKEYKNEKL